MALPTHRGDESEYCPKVVGPGRSFGRSDEEGLLFFVPRFPYPVERSQGQRGRSRHATFSRGQGNSVSASSRTSVAVCCQPGYSPLCKIGKTEWGEISNYKVLLYNRTFFYNCEESTKLNILNSSEIMDHYLQTKFPMVTWTNKTNKHGYYATLKNYKIATDVGLKQLKVCVAISQRWLKMKNSGFHRSKLHPKDGLSSEGHLKWMNIN